MTYIFYCLNCKSEYGAEHSGDFEKLDTQWGTFDIAECLNCGEKKAKVIGQKTMLGTIGFQDPTRGQDLEILSDRTGKYGNKKVFDEVYRQSKDIDIAEGRKKLVEAHRKNDVDSANKIEDGLRKFTKAKYGK